MKLLPHLFSGQRVLVCETLDDYGLVGMMLGGVKEFGEVKYAILLDDNETMLINPSCVYIMLAKEEAPKTNLAVVIPINSDTNKKLRRRK